MWSRAMSVARVLIGAGAVGAFLSWLKWSSPGRVSTLLVDNVAQSFPQTFAQLLAPLPGSRAGLASTRGRIGVLLAVALIVVAVAGEFARRRRGLLVFCACALVAASIGLVIDAATAVSQTVDSTSEIDHALRPTVSHDVGRRLRWARYRIVDHSVRPALFGLSAGGAALVGSLILLAGVSYSSRTDGGSDERT